MKCLLVAFVITILCAGCTVPGAQEVSQDTVAEFNETKAKGIPIGESSNGLVIGNGPIQTMQEENTVSRELEPQFGVEPLPEEIIKIIDGCSFTQDSPVTLEELVYVTVTYVNFKGERAIGNLIVHKQLGQEVVDIFEELLENEFPIADIQLVDAFDADDSLSMEANNTYAFCTRKILGTANYSNHSYGIAVDINPIQNPYWVGAGVLPAAGEKYLDRQAIHSGMILPGDVCHNAFVSRGWTWGGDWPNPDYQHFEKQLN